jgi:hypothetical protein
MGRRRVCSQSAARVPGALEFAEAKDGGKPRIKQRFDGKPKPCILVPVEAMIGEDDGTPTSTAWATAASRRVLATSGGRRGCRHR